MLRAQHRVPVIPALLALVFGSGAGSEHAAHAQSRATGLEEPEPEPEPEPPSSSASQSLPDLSQRLDAALAAHQRKDYKAAYAQFAALAKTSPEMGHEGMSDAAYMERARQKPVIEGAKYWLAYMTEQGEGTQQDYTRAAQLYQETTDPQAYFQLAGLYEQGKGVSRDLDSAYRWYSAAASQGHPQAAAAAERVLHAMHHPQETAHGSPFDAAVAAYARRNNAWALEQFLTLAESGNLDAQIYSAHLLWDAGKHGEAIRWARAAGEQGDAGAQDWLANVHGQESALDVNGRPLTDYAEAAHWLQKAAEQGHAEAQLQLGNAYRAGKGVAKNDAETDRWYQQSHRNREVPNRLSVQPECADLAEIPALAEVHGACNHGDSAATTRALAKLAKQGDARAQNWLGCLYLQGLPGGDRTAAPHPFESGFDLMQPAAKLIRAAAEQGYAPAQYNLGLLYEHGMGLPHDRKSAHAWYQKAADQKLPEALRLGY